MAAVLDARFLMIAEAAAAPLYFLRRDGLGKGRFAAGYKQRGRGYFAPHRQRFLDVIKAWPAQAMLGIGAQRDAPMAVLARPATRHKQRALRTQIRMLFADAPRQILE